MLAVEGGAATVRPALSRSSTDTYRLMVRRVRLGGSVSRPSSRPPARSEMPSSRQTTASPSIRKDCALSGLNLNFAVAYLRSTKCRAHNRGPGTLSGTALLSCSNSSASTTPRFAAITLCCAGQTLQCLGDFGHALLIFRHRLQCANVFF